MSGYDCRNNRCSGAIVGAGTMIMSSKDDNYILDQIKILTNRV